MSKKHDYSKLTRRDMLIEKMKNPFCFINAQNVIIDFNPSFLDLLGLTKENVANKKVNDVLKAESQNKLLNKLSASYKKLNLHRYEIEFLNNRNEKISVLLSISPIIENNHADGRIAVFENITPLKEIEEQLKMSKEEYMDLFDNSPDMYHITDLNGTIILCNKKESDILGIPKEELIGKNFKDIISNHLKEKVEKIISKTTADGFLNGEEIEITGSSNSIIPVEITGILIKDSIYKKPVIRFALRDISKERKLQNQLLHMQKMESIGTLAGGIAHDFNNILVGILGYTSFVRQTIEESNPVKKYIEIIEKSALRASELTSQLLTFARGGKYQTDKENVNEILEEVVKFLKQTIDKKITIQTVLNDVTLIEADAGQIYQAFLNICINARDAMPDGGLLNISTSTVKIDKNSDIYSLGLPAGNFVKINFTDTGCGMSKETQEKIFEPFFTTKETGKGTGLGLAMVYGIVKNHNGHIKVYSEAGKGTTFKIYLPSLDITHAREISEKREAIIRGGDETILIVDDEEIIRELGREILSAKGYSVFTASDGYEGIKVFSESKKRINLVILDVMMPKISGEETFTVLKDECPDIKVILSSGYGKNNQIQKILNNGALGFVQKPYKINDLLVEVRKVLDSNN